VLGNALGTLQASVGQLVEGGVGDLCMFDPQAAWTVQADALRSQGKHTPFSGYELPGQRACHAGRRASGVRARLTRAPLLCGTPAGVVREAVQHEVARLLAPAARAGPHSQGPVVAVRFPALSPDQQHARVQAWSMQLLARAGVSLRILGTPPVNGPVMLVANHISWLDIPVMHAARHCRFVSKSDVQAWPLIGTLATAAGTLYIERNSRRDALRMVRSMHEALERGEVLAVFPEGTTGDGRAMLPFHANLLQAAVAADAPVQPVGLRFADKATGMTSFAPSYIGDETLVGSIWRTLRAPAIEAVVHYGVPEQAQGRDRRAWTQHLHDTVDRLRQT
jgi:1-acyl-sn-glycerol-3-phosphate acyltransferase